MVGHLLYASKRMSFILQPLHFFVAVLIEYVRDQQELVIDYLQLENQVIREQIGGNRVLLTDEQRRLLAVKGNALGRKQLDLPAKVKERLGKKRGCREQTWLDESVEIDERTNPTGADLSRCGRRASLRGFIADFVDEVPD